MAEFSPLLTALPAAQRRLWSELDVTPERFTLYGGTAIALRLGHRQSVDFDFFSNHPFDPGRLASEIAYLRGAEQVRIARNTLVCRVERGGSVLVSFFGALGLGQAAPCDTPLGRRLRVASLLDLAGTKVAVVSQRAEIKDYLDIDALLQQGIDLPTALAAGRILYGDEFNPLLALKALCFFEDLREAPEPTKERLRSAVAAVDPARLPRLTPFAPRPTRAERTS